MTKECRISFAEADGMSRRAYYSYYRNYNRKEADRRQELCRARRERQIRRRMTILAFIAAALVFCAAFMIFGIHSDASSVETAPGYKYYTSVVVGYGDDFDTVIDRYYDANYYESRSEYAEEICDINGFYSYSSVCPSVRPGDHLIMSYYSTQFK